MAPHWPTSFYHLICTGFDPRLVIAATSATLLPRARLRTFRVRLPGIRKACTAPSPPLRKPARGGWVYLGVVLATPFVLCGAASVHGAMHALFGAPVQWN